LWRTDWQRSKLIIVPAIRLRWRRLRRNKWENQSNAQVAAGKNQKFPIFFNCWCVSRLRCPTPEKKAHFSTQTRRSSQRWGGNLQMIIDGGLLINAKQL
jgi:hypothetical protein